jgi:hypothetical protein
MTVMGDNGGPQDADWIRAYRSLRTHEVVGFLNPDGSRRKGATVCETMAWLDLCMEANWRDRRVNNRGKVVLVERGQLLAARAWLASRWGWTEDKVRWFLRKLQSEDMISLGSAKMPVSPQFEHSSGTQSNTQKRAHHANALTICNYNIYQTLRELSDYLSTQSDTQSTPNQHPHLKKERKIYPTDTTYPTDMSDAALPDHSIDEFSLTAEPVAKTRKKARPPVSEYTADFEEFWKLYPRREGKGDAFRQWQRHAMPEKRRIYAKLREHLPGLLAKKNDPAGNFCAMPATWLSQKRYDDEVGQPKPQVNGFNGHASFEDRRAESASNWLLNRPLPEKRPEPVLEAEF